MTPHPFDVTFDILCYLVNFSFASRNNFDVACQMDFRAYPMDIQVILSIHFFKEYENWIKLRLKGEYFKVRSFKVNQNY